MGNPQPLLGKRSKRTAIASLVPPPVVQQDVVVGTLPDQRLVVVEVSAGGAQAQVRVVVLPRAGQLPIRAREQRVGPRPAP